MGNAAVKASALPAEGLAGASPPPHVQDINWEPERAFQVPSLASNVSAGTSTADELLVELWQRRAVVEQALHVAMELFAEAEAAALQLRGGSALSVEVLRAKREAAVPRRAALSPKEHDDAIAHLLELRAALAEADSAHLLAYAGHAAAWSDIIAMNPLLGLWFAQGEQRGTASPDGLSRNTAKSPPAGAALSPAGPQAIRSGRRFANSAPSPPGGPSKPQSPEVPVGLTRAQALLRSAAQKHATSGQPPSGADGESYLAELVVLREELARVRRRCAELAKAEREAREEAAAMSRGSAGAGEGRVMEQQQQQQQLDAADMALDVALSAVEALRRQWSADSTALATRLGNVRKQASSLRDVAEASRWDVAGASETAAQEAITVLAAAEQHVRSSHAILETDAMPVQLQTSDSQDVWALQEALDAAHRRCAELTAAAAQGQAARDALSVHEAQLADALSRAQEAEHLVVSLKQSHVFAEEALRAAHSRRTALEAQVAEMQRRLETAEGIASSNKSGGIFGARPPPQSEADWLSEAGFSDASSALGTGELVDPARVRKQREEARARAAANKARFEAIRQERNALRMQARSTAAELEAMRAEVSRVAELKQQLTSLEKSAFFIN